MVSECRNCMCGEQLTFKLRTHHLLESTRRADSVRSVLRKNRSSTTRVRFGTDASGGKLTLCGVAARLVHAEIADLLFHDSNHRARRQAVSGSGDHAW